MAIAVCCTGCPKKYNVDEKIAGIMASSGIPGVSIALAKNSALVLTRGYGRVSMDDGHAIGTLLQNAQV